MMIYGELLKLKYSLYGQIKVLQQSTRAKLSNGTPIQFGWTT